MPNPTQTIDFSIRYSNHGYRILNNSYFSDKWKCGYLNKDGKLGDLKDYYKTAREAVQMLKKYYKVAKIVKNKDYPFIDFKII